MNRKRIQAQVSITELIYNGCFAAANFLSVFLESIGIVSQPAWGIVSDRIQSVKKCFMIRFKARILTIQTICIASTFFVW